MEEEEGRKGWELPQEEVDRILSEYATAFSAEDQNRKHRVDRVLAQWHQWRQRLGFPLQVDMEHFHGPRCLVAVVHHMHECTEHCSAKTHYPHHECRKGSCIDNMMLLDAETSLYGCVQSGQHHFCKAALKPHCRRTQEKVYCDHTDCLAAWVNTAQCMDTIVADDSGKMCVYSGSTVGQWINVSLYEKPKKNRGRFQCGSHTDDASSITSSNDDDVQPMQLQSMEPAAATKQPKKRQRRPKGSPPDPVRRLETIRTLEGKAAKIVWSLLFDMAPRQAVDRGKKNKFLTSFLHRAELYAKYCKQKSKSAEHPDPPLWHVVQEIFTAERAHWKPLPRADPEVMERMARHYSRMCVRMWKTMNKRASINCTYQQFVLGLLYSLGGGITKGGVDVAAKDEFLAKYLPKEGDLEYFGNDGLPYKKNFITSGCNNINRAVAQCPLEDLKRAADGEGWTNDTYLNL